MARFSGSAVLAATLAAATAHATAIVVDGRFDPAEGYTVQATITPNDPNVSDANAYFYQDPTTKDLFVAIVLPLDHTDNSYGWDANDCSHTHHSWYKKACGQNPNQASDKAHLFVPDLLNSDHAAFTISRAGNSSSFAIDLLFPGGSGPSGYTSGTAGDDGSDPDLAVILSATSLDYDVNHFTPVGADAGKSFVGSKGISPQLLDPADLSSYETVFDYSTQAGDGWIFENVYEFQIDGNSAVIAGADVLGPSGFTAGFSLTFDDLHASPPKSTIDAFVGTEPTFTPIPEPRTALLVGLGVALLGARRRGRRR